MGLQRSGVITGIDRTAPTITVGSITNNKVSAFSAGFSTFQAVIIYDGVCSSSTTAAFRTYTSNTELTLPAVVGARVCFKAVDSLGNERYVSSDPYRDITSPIITPHPRNAHSTPKRAIAVTADSGSSDVNNNTWRHKVILGSAACNAAAMSSLTSFGKTITLASESHNNRKVCFAVQDNADNWLTTPAA